MDLNKLLINLLGMLPVPLARGVATAIVLTILAFIYNLALLAAQDAGLPLSAVTRYLAVVAYWLPLPAGVIVFGFYLWKAIAAARRDNRR